MNTYYPIIYNPNANQLQELPQYSELNLAENSVAIGTFYDSDRSVGLIGQYLSVDIGGVKWTSVPPTAQSGGISIFKDGSLVGAAFSFNQLNFLGDLVGIVSSTSPLNTALITVLGQWNKNSSGLSTTGRVGIGSTQPSIELDVIGNARISGVLTATTFAGTATTSTNINISATTSTDTTTSVVLVADQSTGGQAPFIDSGLTYNANTNNLIASLFSGDVSSTSGTITNLSGTIGTITTLNSTSGTVTTLSSTNLTGTNLSGTIGTVTTLTNSKANLTNVNVSGITTFTNTTDNTLGNPDTGAVQIDGGLGVNLNVSIDGSLDVDGTTELDALNVSEAATFANLIQPSFGNQTDKGIEWVNNPGGGSGDRAFIKYYADGGGENTRLLIGIENDASDDLRFEATSSSFSGSLSIESTTQSTSKDTGALIIEGGVGIEKSLFVGELTNSTSGSFTNLSGTIGTITTLGSTNFTGTNISGTIGTVTRLGVTNFTGTNISGTIGTVTNFNTTNLSGTIGTITTLNSTNATLTNINSSGTTTLSRLGVTGVTTTQHLSVSGVATVGSSVTIASGNINAAGVVTATSFVGSGVNLTGIVTQIAAGIGINLSSTQTAGKGVVTVNSYYPIGKTIFVTQNGNDNNTGLTENDSKRTVKAAAAIAFPGDTIKVFPGVYVENNPIVLAKTVSVEGTELRNCVITPRYTNRDLFHVNNGCHLTDLSFIGDAMTDGAAVVALQPLLGVATDRFFDAARMIRLNLDYIAQEAVGFLTSGFSGFAGSHRDQDAARLIELNKNFIAAETIGFLTSTDYKTPAFTVVNSSGIATDPVNCEDDIKSILDAIAYDLKAGSNKKSIGAGLSYYNNSGTLLHITGNDPNGYSVKQATIDAINYAVGIVTNVINNVDYGSLAGVTTYSNLTQDFSYSPILVGGGCTDVVARIQNRAGIVTQILGSYSAAAGITTIYGVTLESQDCADDVKDIWKCVIHDVTRGGNSRCVAAGKSYYDADWNLIPQILKNPGEKQQTVATLDYSFNIARSIINNSTWGGYPVGVASAVTNAVYDGVSGITTITAAGHGLSKNDAVKINGLEFTCPGGSGITTTKFPDGTYGSIFNVKSVIDSSNFEVVVGPSTITHTYSSGGTVQKYTNFNHQYTQIKDLSMQPDPETGFNNAINGCANVVSALRSCIGVVTTIVGFGSTAGITTSYPGNRGFGLANSRAITTASYGNASGITTITLSPGYSLKQGDIIEVRDLVFSCDSGTGIGTTTQKFPSGKYGYEFYVNKINDDGTVAINVGVSTLPHTYVSGGFVVDRSVAITTAAYNNLTGITTVKAPGTVVRVGDIVTLRDLNFSCTSGAATTTIYPTGNTGYDFPVLTVTGNTFRTATNAVYDPVSGITTITSPSHGFSAGDKVIIKDRSLIFTCSSDGDTQQFAYPRYQDPISGKIIPISNVTTNTFTINAGASPVGQQFTHTFVKARANGIERVTGEFTVNVGTSTIPHTYVSGGFVLPSYSKGVGPITQGPYIRNCTNFVADSIGMRIDGFAAEPGDKDDIGVTGTMSVDSFTQYNQGGIGVSITNGAYAQLVSIFTICNDIAIYTASGGQCDITNSNSSFGNYGLYSTGVGNASTKSIYRQTGVAVTDVAAKNNIIEVSGVGTNRPYDGQVCYFGDLYYFVDEIEVTNGGSGYSVAPRVTVSAPTGPNGISAQVTSTIDAFGRVVALNILNSGSQYSSAPTITIDPPAGVGVTATASVSRLQPIYYRVSSATLPVAGISTITLLQTINNNVSAGTTVYFARGSLQLASTISFEHVGAGTNIFTAKPALGGVVIPENKVVQIDGGTVTYTSTDQSGNFNIGDGIVINQSTGQISGRDFTKALFTTMTPFILALSD